MLIRATRYEDCAAALGLLTGVLEMPEQAVHRDESDAIVRSCASIPAC